MFKLLLFSKYSRRAVLIALLFSFALNSCKDSEDRIIENNQALVPHRVATIKVEHYVNRSFIDLIGRSPLPEEMTWGVELLRKEALSKAVRKELITFLQTDTSFRQGDISYKDKYYQRIYDIIKSRMCEGAGDEEFSRYVGLAEFAITVGRLEGDSVKVFKAFDQIIRNQRVIDSRLAYMNGEVLINEIFARMLDNNVYDVINMNSFNFVNASFDDLFYRLPTQKEFEVAYGIIDNFEMGTLFGDFASNKREYCIMLSNSSEFYEGLIHWTYLNLMGRDASTQEVHNHYADLVMTNNFQELQLNIMITDEYADF